MAKRRCLGCPTLIEAGSSRCTSCARAKDKARGSRQSRGYDAAHDQLRADWQRRMDDGETIVCASCPRVLNGQPWDLGHNKARTGYIGPQCVPCNRGHLDPR